MSQYKLAYILDQYLPVKKANSENAINTASALAAEGLDVELIIPRKWRTLGKRKTLLHKQLIDFYHIENGFDITQLLSLPFSPFKLTKVVHGLLAPIYARISNHDIIYTRNSMPALVALALRKKVIFEAFRVFDQHKSDAVTYLAKLTNSLDSLIIAAQSLPSKETLIQAGAAGENLSVIPTGFNPGHLTPLLTKAQARRKLGWNEQDKIACYTGRIDIDKGVYTILELAKRTPEINYVLIGYSKDYNDDWILDAAARKGLQNVRWFPWVTLKNLAKYLYAADVLIIPPTAEPMLKYGGTVLPMKSLIYMGAGRCILAPALPDTKNILNEHNATLIEPDNIDSAQEGIERIFEDEAWAQSMARQAQLDSKNFTWQSRAKRIIAFMNERFGSH